MNTPTYITIRSSNGSIRVDRKTGDVIGRKIVPHADLEYHTVYHFDLDEYFTWDTGSDRATCEEIDIVGINYTYLDPEGNAVVEPFAEGWRKDVEAMQKENRRKPNTKETQHLQYMESTMDNVVHELLGIIEPSNDESRITDLYHAFRDAVQTRIQEMHPDTDFGNF